jgi:hypothetical protein
MRELVRCRIEIDVEAGPMIVAQMVYERGAKGGLP